MPNQSGKIVLLLVVVFLAIGFSTYFFLPGFKKQEYAKKITNEYQNSKESNISGSGVGMKDYHSKNLKISLKIPESSKIEEKNSYLAINLAEGNISMTFNGTNFENSKDYFSELKEKNKITPLTYSEGKLGKYDYILITDENLEDKSETEKIYFMYSDNRIFAFSTSDEALYPVLDQIVQSFEYKGTLTSGEDKP